jgi:hypothetical protein
MSTIDERRKIRRKEMYGKLLLFAFNTSQHTALSTISLVLFLLFDGKAFLFSSCSVNILVPHNGG